MPGMTKPGPPTVSGTLNVFLRVRGALPSAQGVIAAGKGLISAVGLLLHQTHHSLTLLMYVCTSNPGKMVTIAIMLCRAASQLRSCMVPTVSGCRIWFVKILNPISLSVGCAHLAGSICFTAAACAHFLQLKKR